MQIRLEIDRLKSRNIFMDNKKYYLSSNLVFLYSSYESKYKNFCKLRKQRQNSSSMHFDTDSFEIGVDNHSSKCISNNLKDFVGPITECAGSPTGIQNCL